MKEDDRLLAEALERATPDESPSPAFGEVFARAEAEVRRGRRRRVFGGLAAAASAAVLGLVLVLSGPEAPPTGLEVTGLLDTTLWVAPSDALLPEHEVDIFEELPAPSTELVEGALL